MGPRQCQSQNLSPGLTPAPPWWSFNFRNGTHTHPSPAIQPCLSSLHPPVPQTLVSLLKVLPFQF